MALKLEGPQFSLPVFPNQVVLCSAKYNDSDETVERPCFLGQWKHCLDKKDISNLRVDPNAYRLSNPEASLLLVIVAAFLAVNIPFLITATFLIPVPAAFHSRARQ